VTTTPPESDPDHDPNDLVPLPQTRVHSDEDEHELVDASLVEARSFPLSKTGIVAWTVVLSVTLLIFSLVTYSQIFAEQEIGGDASASELMNLQMQGKLIVGQQQIMALDKTLQTDLSNSLPEELNTGSYEQRLCYAILKGELEGPNAAIEQLLNLDKQVREYDLELTADQKKISAMIEELNQQYKSGELNSSDILPLIDRQLLESRLGWTGRLALLPGETPLTIERAAIESEAFTMLVILIIMSVVGLGIGLASLTSVIVLIVKLTKKKITPHFEIQFYNHNIYIETFAVWMCLFFGTSILLGMLPFENPTTAMYLQPLIFFGSLICLVWPILRGIPFSQVRQDIGWTWDNPLREIMCAIPTYLATLSLLVPGFVIMFILMALVSVFQQTPEFASPIGPSHPIQELLAEGGTTMVLMIFVTACIAAPIVEETVFRGILYRHLRDVKSFSARWMSVLFAAIINSLIFAAIHPQGIYGIPILAMLAIGFSLAREWRGSLISSMAMHAIHNTLVTCVMLTIL
jgi:membrane protease YdiL (CAAX protease family)